ncbi:MAG: hypothetical protein Q4A32_00245 [Lachnospiraceae bacterium]|nr:hypothetical protein [Lachnospiraceae bacterium]
MDYFISERQFDKNAKLSAGGKARDDISRILSHMGMKAIRLSDFERGPKSLAAKLAEHIRIAGMWHRAFAHVKRGDVLYVQFPPILHTVFYVGCISSLQKKGVKVILIIHDLEILRWKKRKDATVAKRLRFDIEEKSVLFRADGIIAHNEMMKGLLANLGIDGRKIRSLRIFDYLIPPFRGKTARHGARYGGPVLIAGSLARHKAGYAYSLPGEPDFALFGTNYDGKEQDNIRYMGAVSPDELPYLLDGSFGLVWDGDSCETCSGVYGEYLAYNNPHKASLYLASGIPIIIWDGAALAQFVRKENCGITVSSLTEIGPALACMSEPEYAALRENAARIGRKLRRGTMTESCIRSS